ncbi:hypothetical protein [Rhizobium halophytocola]|uniref:Uncharacterized protein n=1 Tax=Rhizobium halophytocola TaxID=735519 RepID=A0ABS4E616_9HYPH|nr:hypothetical protein [Rhizobium halophytocola]MBP1853391.1 hypothetical protein [Rhizobium halophytocola]
MRSEPHGTLLTVSIWYEPKTACIKIASPDTDWLITTVNDNPESERGHPNLFGKLARYLREKDKPAPPCTDYERRHGLDTE